MCAGTLRHTNMLFRGGEVKMGVITLEREFGVRVCPRRREGNLSEWRRRREANWKVKSGEHLSAEKPSPFILPNSDFWLENG